MIAFACPHCSQKFQVKDEFAGRAAKCLACKKALTVPARRKRRRPPPARSTPPRAPWPRSAWTLAASPSISPAAPGPA